MFRPVSRRQMLQQASAGFGFMALSGLLAEQARASGPLAPKPVHVPARAKRVIFLFMHGGPSQVDTFDYKPQLQKMDGQQAPFKLSAGASDSATAKLLASPWKFQQHGESGIWVSELFPEVAKHVDDLCILKGMHTNGQSHGQAVMKLHTGSESQTRPSLGSWLVYGLGTENSNLPGFVTICPPRGHGGAMNYGNAFLPAAYQGTAIGSADQPASTAQIRYITNQKVTPECSGGSWICCRK